LENGQPLRLEPFQRVILSEFFGGALETLALLPKKNGKSSLLGALALYHLCTTPDAECVIAAASRDQAAIMLRQAQGFIRRSRDLQARLRVKQREIAHQTLGGRVRVLASDVDTADGVIPTLGLVDELHRHRSGELYGVLRDGLGPRDGRLVTISTAGADYGGPLWRIRGAALELGATRDGAYRHARSPDGSFVLHEWSLSQDDDLHDLVLVKEANPLAAMTVAKLAERRDSPTTTPGQWARFACNVWTQAEEFWLPEGAWDACRDETAVIPDGVPVVLGVDIGTKKDTSAIVRLWCRDDGRVVVEADVFAPQGDGTALELATVEQAIRDSADRFMVQGVVYDRWSFERSAQELSDRGLLMIELPQSPERMSMASAAIYEAILKGEIAHAGGAVLTAHVLAGAVKPHERGWRLVKSKARRPIDALIAMALAFTEIDRAGMAGTSGQIDWL